MRGYFIAATDTNCGDRFLGQDFTEKKLNRDSILLNYDEKLDRILVGNTATTRADYVTDHFDCGHLGRAVCRTGLVFDFSLLFPMVDSVVSDGSQSQLVRFDWNDVSKSESKCDRSEQDHGCSSWLE